MPEVCRIEYLLIAFYFYKLKWVCEVLPKTRPKTMGKVRAITGAQYRLC